MRDRDVAFCTLGTRGDINPILLLAEELSKRDWRVTILSNENWREPAESLGAAFVSIAEQDEPQEGRDDRQFFLASTLPSFRKAHAWTEEAVSVGRRPTLIYRSNMLGMECAAERLGLVSIRMILQPSAIKSFERPPWPMSALTEGRLGWLGTKFIVPSAYALGKIGNSYRKDTNQFRRSIGLPKRGIFDRHGNRDDCHLIFCPDWFAIPQDDWPRQSHLVGFPYGPVGQLDAELAAFLDRHPQPIVFTPGTGIENAGAFFARGAEVVARSGHPGILLGRNIPEKYRFVPNLYCTEFACLSALLPRARAIFHHGGIGTTAESIRAGIPQLLFPNRFDQPDNAMRVAAIGLGAAIMSERYTAKDWTDLLSRTLSSPHVANQVATAARLVMRDDAIGLSAELVEHFTDKRLRQRATDAPLPPQI